MSRSVRDHRAPFGVAVLFAATLCGCGDRQLVVTPNVLRQQDPAAVFAACPPPLRVPQIEVVYVTDRDVKVTENGPVYGHARASRLAFGIATVGFNPATEWTTLAADSTAPDRRQNYVLKTAACREFACIKDRQWDQPAAPTSDVRVVADQNHAADEALSTELVRRLTATPQKDVFVFIHGFDNTFEDAVIRAAEVWHFLGRVGVPIAYTWPAGYGGLRGYAYDRESGEFTIFHLKEFLRAVAACPAVERVHLIAHSRGTDVAVSALRELHIACRAQGRSTQQELKLENLVLAAPDLDEEVFCQRFVAEELLNAARRTTIYASRSDKAIEAADILFASRQRLGTVGPRDFTPGMRAVLARLPNLQIVECRVKQFTTSHDYVFANPAALSDLILVLRDRRGPGPENGRPLAQPVEGIWELNDDYLLANARTK